MAHAVPYGGTAVVAGSGPYRRLASEFTTRLDLLLSAKRLLLHRRQVSASPRSLRQLHGEIDTLREQRAYWALQCPGDDARFWIGTYRRLAEICDRAAAASPDSPDTTSLRQAAHLYRDRLLAWQGREFRQR
jgi:hypothetical protein